MPNWCCTDYRCYGNKGELVELKEKFDYLSSLEKPLVQNGFGKLWCGCLVSLMEGDWNKVYCRGEIDSYEFSGTTLCISVTSAWNELGEWRKFIKSKFPNIHIVYSAERYILDFTDGLEYFNTLESAVEYVKALTGKDVKTEEDITSALDELEEKVLEENEDAFYSFNKFTVLEEDEP